MIMTKKEQKIVDLAVIAMKTIMSLARKPIVTRKGAAIITVFLANVDNLPSNNKKTDS